MVLSSNYNNNNNHGSTPSSGSSGSDVVLEGEYVSRFKELNSENFKRLCNALEKKVPWQKNVVGDIASAVLQCRSGMGRRKGKMGHGDFKEETWLLFQGNLNTYNYRLQWLFYSIWMFLCCEVEGLVSLDHTCVFMWV